MKRLWLGSLAAVLPCFAMAAPGPAFFRIPAEDIAHVRVLQTMVGGRIVYDSGELARATAPGP